MPFDSETSPALTPPNHGATRTSSSFYELTNLEQWARRNKVPEHQLKKVRSALFKKALPLKDCIALLAPDAQAAFLAEFSSGCLELVARHDSRLDGASKLIFRTQDGLLLEAVVLRITSGRTSLCVSSQVGCAAGCAFCATGKMGLFRNLSTAEILDQVLLAMRLLREEGRALRNVVFMGMGEPLHNEKAVYAALETLRDPRGFYFSERHLLVSTVGMTAAMLRFVEHFPAIRLALSLHSARQEIRRLLMPAGKSQSLSKLKEILPEVTRHENFMIEYLMLKGVNDGPEDLEALENLLSGYPVHINLIQFNPHPGADFQPVTTEAREAFGAALRRAGFKVTLRYSLGQDIAAACGQLASLSAASENHC